MNIRSVFFSVLLTMRYDRSQVVSALRLSSRRQLLGAQLLLAVAIALLFGRVIDFPFIAFDDVELITHNPELTRPWRAPLQLLLTPHVGYVVPVSVSIEACLYALSNGHAWSFHAAALLLHIVYAGQLVLFGLELGVSLPLAWSAAIVFALHPLVVQPVAWAICLKDLLMANLVLAATRRFVRSTLSASPRAHWAALGLAVLAMLAKPSAAPLGIAWLAYAVASSRRAARTPERPRAFAFACMIIGIALAWVNRFRHDALLGRDALAAWSPTTPLAVLGQQLLHVAWPLQLAIVYPAPVEEPSLALTLLGALGVLLFAGLVVAVRRQPAQLLLLLICAALYLPTSNVLPFGRVISDSYMYVPLSMLLLALALAFDARAAANPRAPMLFGVALALVLAPVANIQLERWRGGRALWDPVVRDHPRLQLAHRLRGDELLWRGEPAAAAGAYRQAYALYYDPRYLLQFGTILSLANRLEDAECTLIEAVMFGDDRDHALFNFAALLAVNPDYASRYPSFAKRLLSEFARRRRSGVLRFPAELDPGLARQTERLRSAPDAAPRWLRRSCAVMQP